MKRHRIVDLGPDATRLQVRAKPVALRDANDELVVDVPAPLGFDWQRDAAAETRGGKQLAVRGGIRAAPLVPPRQVRQLHAENRGLQRIHPEISADCLVHVLRMGAVIAQKPDARRELIIVGRHEPGIAEGADVLGRKERKASSNAKRSGRKSILLLVERQGDLRFIALRLDQS